MAITYSSPTITVTGGTVTGTATSGTATTLTDTSKSWTVNAYTDRLVLIHTGTGAGTGKCAVGRITSNTATQLTVDGGFYAVDCVNRTKAAITPDSTSQYVICHNMQDIVDANTTGGWGVITKQGTRQFALSGATQISIGNGSTVTAFQTLLEDINFSSSVTLPCLRVKASAFLVSGGPRYESRGSSIKNEKTTDSSTDTDSLIYVEASGTVHLYGGTQIKCAGAHSSLVTISGSYAATLGGTGNKVISTSCAQIRQRTANFYCDGLAHIDGITGVNAQATFAQVAAVPAMSNLLLRGLLTGLSGSTSVGASTYEISNMVSLNNTNDALFWGGHTFNLIDPSWSASISALNNVSATGTFNEKYTYGMTLKNSSDVAISGVQVFCKDVFGTQAFNTSADGSGVVSQQKITYKSFVKSVALSTSYTTTTYSPHTFRYRKYGYQAVQETSTVNAPILSSKSLLTNAFVVATEATAAAYTGVSISGAGKTITLSSARSVQEIYDYSQAWADDSGNMQYDEPLSTVDGTNFTITASWVLNAGTHLSYGGKRLSGGVIKLGAAGTYSPVIGTTTIDFTASGTFNLAGIDCTGTVTFTNSSGGSVTAEIPAGLSYVNTGPNITISAPQVYATATVLANTRVQLYNVTTDTEIDNAFVTGTSYSYAITSEAVSGDVLRLRACKLGKVAGEASGVWGSSGVEFLVTQPDDSIYTTWGIDGSTITEFSGDVTGHIYIDANDLDGLTTKVRLGAWYSYVLTTEIGIRHFYGAVSYLAANAIRINVDVADILIENVNSSTALTFTDTDVRLYRSDGTSIIAPTSYSIHNDYSGVPDVVETGVSGLTGAESTKLMGLSDAAGIWGYGSRTLTSGGGGITSDDVWSNSKALTVSKFLGLQE